MTYVAADDRYDHMPYRRCGRSGLQLPADLARPVAQLRRRPPDRDAAGDPAPRVRPRRSPTSTWPTTTARRTARPRSTSGASSPRTSARYRDELVISTKAGYDMWPGPYGEWGSRKYLLASLDQCLRADGPRLRRHLLLAPLRPGHAARGDDGRARHRGPLRARRSTPASPRTPRSAPRRPSRSCASWARRCSSTSRPTRCSTAGSRTACSTSWARGGRLHRLLAARAGHAHRPLPRRHPGGLARRRATGRCRSRCSATRTSRASARSTRSPQRRGQTLAQLALAWALRDPRVTSVLIGASSVAQLEDNLGALARLDFDDDELAEIETYAVDAGINIWERSSSA